LERKEKKNGGGGENEKCPKTMQSSYGEQLESFLARVLLYGKPCPIILRM
jgi:hypothetical protein